LEITDEDYENIVRNMFKNFHILGCNMSLKVNFLFSHLNFFPKNLGAVSEEQGERLDQDIKQMERKMERINDGRLLLDVTARCTQKKYTAGNQLKDVSSQSVKDAILIRNKKCS
jgi:hypothetical protein